MNLIEKVNEVIGCEGLIPEGARVIAGVSGGADSTALLHILHRLGCPLEAAHLHHGIRGDEADADEAFVKTLCKQLGVECITAKTDVPALAAANGWSVEMAAREARHDFFRSLSPVTCHLSPVIALAHHADDQLETFFLRAARGTGPGGLGGMRCRQEVNGLTLIRPLLGIRRSEILQWLEAEGLEWREDASNADETIPRNLIRRRILPVLEKVNERAAENILRTMEILRDEEDHPERAARRREIRDGLIAQGVTPTFDAVEQFIEFSSRTDGTALLDVEGVRFVNEYGKVGRSVLSEPKTVTIKESIGILRGPWCASVSLAKVRTCFERATGKRWSGRSAHAAVIVRAPRPGDRMNPYGMEGSRKLQDIFTDLKIPKAQRADWPVVECGGEIIWVPGYRIARGWELSLDTEPALHLFCEG